VELTTLYTAAHAFPLTLTTVNNSVTTYKSYSLVVSTDVTGKQREYTMEKVVLNFMIQCSEEIYLVGVYICWTMYGAFYNTLYAGPQLGFLMRRVPTKGKGPTMGVWKWNPQQGTGAKPH